MMALDRSPELCNVISNAKHMKTIILTKIQNATSRVLTRFSFIVPSDQVFYLIWPSFELILDLMEMNDLINFHEDQMQNVACRVLTRQSLTTDDARRTKCDHNRSP